VFICPPGRSHLLRKGRRKSGLDTESFPLLFRRLGLRPPSAPPGQSPGEADGGRSPGCAGSRRRSGRPVRLNKSPALLRHCRVHPPGLPPGGGYHPPLHLRLRCFDIVESRDPIHLVDWTSASLHRQDKVQAKRRTPQRGRLFCQKKAEDEVLADGVLAVCVDVVESCADDIVESPLLRHSRTAFAST
jgi:hypothetical protein